ncbi:MAG: ATP synthase F1 subunit delta [Acidobacteriota bacterium]
MSSFSDDQIAVAQVYSKAMLALAQQAEAQQAGAVDDLREELQSIARLIERDETFRAFLSSPLVDSDKRRESLEKTFRGKASDLLVDSLQVLNRKGRIHLVPAIAFTYRQELNQLQGRVEARVISAVALSDPQRERIRAAVKGATGKDATLDEQVDPSLIGGMVVQIGDQKADSSVATRLTNLSDKLLNRASRQIHRGAHVEN